MLFLSVMFYVMFFRLPPEPPIIRSVGAGQAANTIHLRDLIRRIISVMKKTFSRTLLLLILVLLTSCSPSTEAGQALQVMERYFSALAAGDYAAADSLYGGDYQLFLDWNHDLTAEDHTALWERACKWNGLNCLAVRTATMIAQQDDIFTFTVEFSNPDGSLYILGPCCGADETTMPPLSRFDIRVRRDANGQFKVLDLPVYSP